MPCMARLSHQTKTNLLSGQVCVQLHDHGRIAWDCSPACEAARSCAQQAKRSRTSISPGCGANALQCMLY